MKLLSVILATVISILVVQPALHSFNNSICQEEVCDDSFCSSDDGCSESSNQSNPNHCCPGGICNPFQVCACCVGANPNAPVFEIITSYIKTNFTPINQKNPVLGFNADCFRPPRFA